VAQFITELCCNEPSAMLVIDITPELIYINFSCKRRGGGSVRIVKAYGRCKLQEIPCTDLRRTDWSSEDTWKSIARLY